MVLYNSPIQNWQADVRQVDVRNATFSKQWPFSRRSMAY